MLLIVPNYLRDQINAAIDAALVDVPEAAADREIFFAALLDHVNEHGVIPEFSLVKREPEPDHRWRFTDPDYLRSQAA
jgi:hypothetical protein